MATGSAAWPTVSDFTFDLSERLRAAARSSLAELEASINRDGYDWLEDYIDNIQVQGRRAPIADLIKTPSRTATAKKTRGATTAQKTRQEQIRLFNAQLSPLAAKSPDVGRQPFSPLQVQSLNALTQSPTPRSPLVPKGAATLKPAAKSKPTRATKAAADEAPKAEPKKRGRPKKKADSLKENESVPSTPSSSRQLRGPAPKAVSPVPTPVKSPVKKVARSPLKEIHLPVPEPEPEPMEIEEEEEQEEEQEEEEEEEEEQEEVIEQVEEVDEPIEIDEPIEVDEDEDELDDSIIEIQQPVFKPTPSKLPLKSKLPTKLPVMARSPLREASPSPVKARSPIKAISPVKTASPAKASSPVKQSSPIKAGSPAKSPAKSPVKDSASVPTRQVRSSWLSQALGTRTVPINHGEGSSTGTYRKSVASNSQRTSSQFQRTSSQFDALHKSTGPGALKRKSEAAEEMEEEDVSRPVDKDSKRAEKMARFDHNAATDAATGQPASPVRSAVFASRAPGSATSLPAPHATTTPAASTTRPTATSVPQEARARHDKVTRALDELRERTAAAAAKQKSHAASRLSTSAPKAATTAVVPTAALTANTSSSTSLGAGFLRGLGNFSSGIFGLSAEDEAARLHREAEDRRAQEQAEAELARIMRDMADEERKTGVKHVPVSESVDEANDMAIVVDDDDDDDEESVNDSITLPELPEPDFGDDYDALPVEEGPASALGARGIDIDFESTTPPCSPPPRAVRSIRAPEIVISPPPRAKASVAKVSAKTTMTAPVRTKFEPVRPPTASSNEDDDADDEDMLDDDMPMTKGKQPRSRLMSSTASGMSTSTTGSMTMSRSSTGILSQAERMAAKSLGVKPATGAVKSVQRAAEAAKKEQAAADRKAALREQIERRRLEDKKRKEREERAAAEEERKRKAAEAEEKRRRWAEAEKNRKEREERMERLQKEKAAREEREAAEARAKAAEEEAIRKRKMALNKTPTIKRIGQPAPAPGTKGKEPLRPAKSATNLTASASSSQGAAASKMGPTSFRTATAAADEHRTPTIQLVNPTGSSRPLGPPSRTSHAPAPQHAAASLQQSRMTLQAQLDAKAAEQASEDIVLPDIASEYSDSDDSDRETDFKRPAWAESPELRHALEQQAHVNPDELFGAIRPLNMEELFKARQGKFRARTSSANWSGADRLTEQEEREYARRMGFKPINAPREGGGHAGDR
ncbi:uncharacterized protein EHS24_000106 [Apiotrichum porosum]|uniref:Inner centromere protein ARK-binding domain-containing protein n=1 Tax=Apiotrichum porosum TaxID=105984 RepID=A0A427Y9B6_9TREE|nr:uncharacterized protein EHS24_000106 [Apiotrichum porosum]RSH87594.1 hypothetical protein EHS24_000106 [Apiotrichum porosum]